MRLKLAADPSCFETNRPRWFTSIAELRVQWKISFIPSSTTISPFVLPMRMLCLLFSRLTMMTPIVDIVRSVHLEIFISETSHSPILCPSSRDSWTMSVIQMISLRLISFQSSSRIRWISSWLVKTCLLAIWDTLLDYTS